MVEYKWQDNHQSQSQIKQQIHNLYYIQPQHEGKNTWEKKNIKEYAARHLIQHYN